MISHSGVFVIKFFRGYRLLCRSMMDQATTSSISNLNSLPKDLPLILSLLLCLQWTGLDIWPASFSMVLVLGGLL